MIEGIPIEITSELTEIKTLLYSIQSEIKELKRERLPANSAEIEGLLKSVFEFFPGTGFTSSWLMEYSDRQRGAYHAIILSD